MGRLASVPGRLGFVVLAVLGFVPSLFTVPASAAPTVSVVVGGGNSACRPEGVPEQDVEVSDPGGMLLLPDGGLLYADTLHNRLCLAGTDGIVRTFAGTGEYSGQPCEGDRLSAVVSSPNGLAMAPDGRIFVSSANQPIVCVIAPDGMVSLFAGRPSGDGSPDDASFEDGGPATSASLWGPGGIVYDERTGALYIPEEGACRIRRVSAERIITTLYATIPCNQPSYDTLPEGLWAPTHLLRHEDTLYVSMHQGHAVAKLNMSTGALTHVAGDGSYRHSGDGGLASLAGVGSPRGLALDPAGNLFVNDYDNGHIRKIDPQGKVSTVASGFGMLDGLLYDGRGGLFATNLRAVLRISMGAPTIVVAGDSYSAGEGAKYFEAPTGQWKYLDGTDTELNRCHRSLAAFGPLYQQRLAEATPEFVEPPQLAFTACSGAVIADFFRPYAENHDGANSSERAQRDAIRAIPNVLEALLTYGGNDAKFPEVMSYCAQRLPRQPTCKKKYAATVDVALYAMRPGQSNELARVYRALQEAAPEARIRVLGYPRFFPEKLKGRCPTGVGTLTFVPSDARWINARIKEMNEIIRLNAEAAGVEYVDVYDAFAGHELCTKEPWMNNAVMSADKNQQAESFHPNRQGQERLSSLL